MLIVWIVAFVVHSTVLLGLAWLASRMLEGRPRACAALWRSALVAPLLTASAQMWLQPQTAWRWSFTEPAVEHVEAGIAPEIDEIAWALAEPPAIEDLELAVPDEEEPVLATPAAVLEVAPPSEPPSSPWSWAELLGVFWLLGALFGLAGIVLGAWRLRSQLVGRRPLRAEWASLLGAWPRVELCVAPRLRVPLVYGVWRPEVCVPARALVELDGDALRAIVAHELGHVVHRDPLWRWIGLVLERVFFFQPLLRLANRELTASSELLADAWAVGRTCHPLALAESLTVVAAWVQPRALPSAAPAMAGPRSQLRRRVERLVEAEAVGLVDPWPRWLAPGLCVAVAGLVAFSPGVSANAMCPRVMSGFEFDPEAHAAVVAAGEDGPTVIVLNGDAEPEVAEAEDNRASAKERRKAKKRVKQAFKRARKRGEVPSDAELAEAVHGKKKKPKRDKEDGMVVVIRGEDGQRAVVRVSPEVFRMRTQGMERELGEIERELRREQRRLERRARAIEEMLEAERRGGDGGDAMLWYYEHSKQKHKHKHKADKKKHKQRPPGRAYGWDAAVAPPMPPMPPAPPHAPAPPHPPQPPTPPTVSLTPVVLD